MTAAISFKYAALLGFVALVSMAQPALADSYVYVPMGGDNRILVIDPERDKVIDTIDGIPAVHGLAGTPDGRFLVAGSYDEREAGTEAPAKPAGTSEADHAAHHAKPVKGSHETKPNVSTVSVIDIRSQEVVRRIDVPGAVHHVAVSPQGWFAAVTHPNGGSVTLIDLGFFEVAATIATGPLPNYAVFSPDGGRLYVSNAGNDTVSTIDTERQVVVSDVTVGGSPEHVVLSKDGATLYVNNVDDETVSVVAVDVGKVVRTIPIGSIVHGLDLSDDGRTLLVAALGDNKLVGIELATGVYRSAPLTSSPYHLATIRGTGKVYVSSADEPKIWSIDDRNFAVLGVIQIGGKGHQMVQVN